MNEINVKVSVELTLSQDVKDFFTSLLGGCRCNCNTEVKQIQTKEVAEEQTEVVKEEVKEVQTEEPKKVIDKNYKLPVSIDDLREVLSQKVANHRDEIKAKLNELGAPSVTKLDPFKFTDLMDFLIELD